MSEQLIASRYILGETLGQGGMGIVYRASDRLTGDTVALKQVLIASANLQYVAMHDHDDMVLTLALEFRTLAGLRHPHIVTVLDYGFDQRLPFLTMQLIAGRQTLSEYGAIQDQADKVRLLIELLEALAYLHRRGVIHRDLKPGNVLISREGVVKVMDFGLALSHNQPTHRDNDRNGPAGTLAYMAPELLLGQQASIQSDLYSVGIMAYELFAGEHPYAVDSSLGLMTNIIQTIPDTAGIDPALAQVVDRLLAKNPDERFAQAREVIEALCAATGQPLPPENAAVRESFLQASSFVGRTEELTTLVDAFGKVTQGEGSAWLVGGESGVGKSRLLDELQTRVLVQGALVLRGQAIAEGGALFQVWRDLLRRLAITIGLNDLEAGIVKQIIPDVGRLLGRTIQDVPPLDGKANIDRLALTMADIVSRACQSRSVVMLMEDLQWADESLEPLRMLARTVSELPLLIICTYRDDERPKLPQELPGMQVLALPRLSTDAIRQLSESMLGEAGQHSDVLELLTRESEGNTFFLIEVVRALAEEAGRLSDVGYKTLPQKVFAGGMAQIMARRLEQVPEWAQPLLKWTAVAGREVDLNLLRIQSDAAETFLNACADAAVLEVADGKWRFSHDKLRETLINGLEAEERRSLNRQVAEAIEALYPGDVSQATRLIDYWRQVGEPSKEIHYSVIVGQQWLSVSAFSGVVELISRVLNYLPEDQVSLERLNLVQVLADAYLGMSDLEPAQRYYEQTLAIARALGNASGEMAALSGVGYCTIRRGDYAAGGVLHEQALAIARQHHDGHAEASALRGIGSAAFFLNDYQTALDYHREAYQVGIAINDLVSAADSISGMAIFAQFVNDPEARTYCDRGLAMSEALGDRHLMQVCCTEIGVYEAKHGNLDGALPYLERALKLGFEINNRYGIAHAYLSITLVHYLRADYEIAAWCCDQTIEYFRQAGVQQEVGSALCISAHILLAQGNRDAGLERIAAAFALVNRSKHYSLPGLLILTYARLLIHEGQIQHSAELVGLVEQSASLPFNIVVSWVQLLRDDLEQRLTPAEIEAANQRAKTLSLDDVFAEIAAAVDHA